MTILPFDSGIVYHLIVYHDEVLNITSQKMPSFQNSWNNLYQTWHTTSSRFPLTISFPYIWKTPSCHWAKYWHYSRTWLLWLYFLKIRWVLHSGEKIQYLREGERGAIDLNGTWINKHFHCTNSFKDRKCLVSKNILIRNSTQMLRVWASDWDLRINSLWEKIKFQVLIKYDTY